MKVRPTPLAVGAFVTGAVTLLVAAILLLGGGELFRPKLEFVIHFDSSLNGLNVGAPVKMQGVQIGTVKDIALQFDPRRGQVLKPVLIEVDPTRIIDPAGRPLAIDGSRRQIGELVERWINDGLRARLELQSLLTGLLYIELNFFPNRPIQLLGSAGYGAPEIPSLPSSVDEIRTAVEELVQEIRKLPLGEIVRDVASSVEEIREALASEDAKQTQRSLAATMKQTEQLLAKLNSRIDPLLAQAEGTLSDTRGAMQRLDATLGQTRKTMGEMMPVFQSAARSLEAAEATLVAAKKTLTTVEDSSGPDSALAQTLNELSDAARSLKTLADYLERHPDALIYGKP